MRLCVFLRRKNLIYLFTEVSYKKKVGAKNYIIKRASLT